jgi:hypothetical protein
MLVGNKNDRKTEREVSRQEAQARADELGIHYVETNSLSAEAARPAFEELIELIATRREETRNLERSRVQMRDSMMIKLSELPKRGEKDSGCC